MAQMIKAWPLNVYFFTALLFLLTVHSSALAREISIGGWRYKTSSSSLLPSDWIPLKRGEPPKIARTFQGYIHYRAEIDIDNNDLSEPLGIFLGQVGDVDAVYINENLVGKTGEFPPQYAYSMDVVREYIIPPNFLRVGPNELYILAYVEYLTHKGVKINDVSVAPHRELSRQRYFEELSVRLPRFVIPILCLILALLSLPWVSQRNKKAQTLLFLLSIDAFVFGLCRSRINMHLFDLLTAYKIHTLTALCAFILLGFYSLEISSMRSRGMFWITACIPMLFAAVILPQKSVLDMAVIFDKWFYVETALICFMTTLVWLYARKNHLWAAIAFTFLSGTVLNDVLVDLHIYQYARLLDLGFGFFVISMIVSQVIDIKGQLIRASQKESDFIWNQRVVQQASQVAHDMRSPLSSIQASLQYFRKVVTKGDSVANYLNLLELSTARLNGIASALLDHHSHKGQGKSIFSLHKVLDELIGEYSSLAIGDKVKFRKEFDTAISCVGDRGKIQRAFGNIIKNAVEAMGESGEIFLNTKMEGNFSIVTITDTGPGMDGEKLARVLTGGYTEGKADGHGIGMSVVRQAVEEHGGLLEADSVVGGGTTFRIKLPIPSSKDFGAVSEVEEGAGTLEFMCASGEPVLVIDDQLPVRLQWELILKEQNTDVVSFESYEAFQEEGSVNTKTAVVDFHLEGSKFNGLEVIRMLKAQGFVNLYLCTAEYWKPVIQQQARELNATIIPKPIPKIVVRNSPQPLGGNSPDTNTGKYSVLVIDDDQLIGLTWKSLKEQMKIKDLHYFPNLESFIRSGLDPSLLDIAFVDLHIENSIHDGLKTLQYLKNKKVKRVVIASGDTGVTDPRLSMADAISKEKVPDSIEDFLG